MNPNWKPRDILRQIPHETVELHGERVELYRLGQSASGRMYELVELHGGERYGIHRHHETDAEIQVISGEGVVFLGGRQKVYSPGDRFNIPRGTWHRFVPLFQTLLLSVQSRPIKDPSTGDVDIEYEDDGR